MLTPNPSRRSQSLMCFLKKPLKVLKTIIRSYALICLFKFFKGNYKSYLTGTRRRPEEQAFVRSFNRTFNSLPYSSSNFWITCL